MRAGFGHLLSPLGLVAVAGVVMLSVGTGAAESRTLHWRSLEVDARLDREGALHVRERQAMVFSGDWNGGERIFDLRPGQELDFRTIQRLDPQTGRDRPLREGNLSEVDHYAWHDKNTLRWRSRLPTDPVFEDTEIVYLLDYSLRGILVRKDDSYRLDHDFAFPDRVGPIESFQLTLELDPVWQVPRGFTDRLERGPLLPGESAVVTADLTYLGQEPPSAVLSFLPDWLRLLPLALAVLVCGWLAAGFLAHERRLGRFRPADAPETLDRTWLEETVFSLRPEEVGALWDGSVGSAEVSALIARWVQEGRLRSTVRESGGFFKRKILELELLADRDSFEGYERRLLDKLFFSKRTKTDTDLIKDRYKSVGFSPAHQIRGAIEARLKKLPGFGKKVHSPDKSPGCFLLLAFVACLALEFWTGGESAVILGVTLLVVGFPSAAIGHVLAHRYHRAADHQARLASFVAVPLLALLALLALAVLAPGRLVAFEQMRLGPGGLLATGLFYVLVVTGVLYAASTRDNEVRVARRKQLARARRLFAAELAKPDPQLDDQWLPYLLAFGLDRTVDRWFRAHAGTASAHLSETSTLSGGSGSTGSSWTGGGGAFGGAGATAAWTAAAGGIAAGVSKPSSGGSGGGSSGGGGGGSSGGGGGGGW